MSDGDIIGKIRFGYAEEKSENVKKCILNHKGFVNNLKTRVEEKMLK